jgi:hypothetical protein
LEDVDENDELRLSVGFHICEISDDDEGLIKGTSGE